MTFIKVPCPTTSTHVCPIGLNNVMHKNAPNQCALCMDQVSASYVAPGSVRTYFPVSATKPTIPIDGTFQK